MADGRENQLRAGAGFFFEDPEESPADAGTAGREPRAGAGFYLDEVEGEGDVQNRQDLGTVSLPSGMQAPPLSPSPSSGYPPSPPALDASPRRSIPASDEQAHSLRSASPAAATTTTTASSSSPSSLTPAQRQRMDEQRRNALARKRKARNAVVAAAAVAPVPPTERRGAVSPSVTSLAFTSAQASKGVVAKRSGFFKDSGAGFILEESDEELDANGPAPQRQTVVYEPAPETSAAYPRHQVCADCKQQYHTSTLEVKFGLHVCNACAQRFKDGKYSMVTKTEAKQEYLLKDTDLAGEQGLRFLERPNPQNERWSKLKLYLRCQVERVCFDRYGGEEGLDEEHVRRNEDRRGKRQKRLAKEVKKLRRTTMTSTWLKKDRKHVHVFPEDQEVYNEETDEWTKTCESCGFQVNFEKM